MGDVSMPVPPNWYAHAPRSAPTFEGVIEEISDACVPR